MNGSKKSYSLIAVDLDGTLLNSSLTVSPRTERALKEAMKRGKEVVFCTGRSLSEMNRYLRQFPELHYAIAEAGACLYDVREQRVLEQKSFTAEESETIFNIVDGMDVMATAYLDGLTYTFLPEGADLSHFSMMHFKETFEESTVWSPELLRPENRRTAYSKFVFFFADPEERVRALQEFWKLPLSAAVCYFNNIELTPQGVDKGTGMEMLSRRLGIPSEEMIAIGDSENDLPMLRRAGLPLAMGNAIPELKRIAAHTLPDCNHDGVAEAIERFLL